MAKNVKREARRVVEAPSAGDRLFIVAGLPVRYLPAVRIAVERALTPGRVISTDFPRTGSLYTQNAVLTLRRVACDFAVQQFGGTEGGDRAPCPSRIVLVYLEDHSSPALLKSFDFFAWPVALPLPVEGLRSGSVETGAVALEVVAACRRGLAGCSHWMEVVSGRGEHPVQLPPQNFRRTDQDVPLGDLLRRARSLGYGPDELREAVPARSFPFGAFPKAKRAVRASVDARDRAFVPDMSGHGMARAVAADEAFDLALVLNQLFRLGCPLPTGRHFDVQRLERRSFKDEAFECAREGQLIISGAHVNVYPNDFVRPGAECTVRGTKSA